MATPTIQAKRGWWAQGRAQKRCGRLLGESRPRANPVWGRGGVVRRTIFRLCSLQFAHVLRNKQCTGISCKYRLSSSAIIRYNPAQMLGHMLGH
jgi:hypothetical protein